MRKVLGAVVVVALTLTVGTVPVGAATQDECRDTRVKTLRVTLRSDTGKVVLGEKARLRVRVVRLIRGVSAGPVEDANVILTLNQQSKWAAGSAETDADGRAVVVVPTDNLRAGLANGVAYASKSASRVPCGGLTEEGLRRRTPLLLLT